MEQKLGEFELNKVYCMDCLEGMKKIPSNSIDLILTDPPYFFEAHGRGFANERKELFEGLKNIGVNKNKNIVDNILLSEFLRVSKKNIFIFCNKSQILDILDFSRNNNLNFELLPLCKTAPMPLSNNQWLPDREWGIHLFKEREVYGDYSTKRGFFLNDNYKQDIYDHPSVKPEYILRRIINNLTVKNQIILDCFMGSGSTAMVCKQLNRNFIGFEISQKYCDMANKRLQQEVLNV